MPICGPAGRKSRLAGWPAELFPVVDGTTRFSSDSICRRRVRPAVSRRALRLRRTPNVWAKLRSQVWDMERSFRGSTNTRNARQDLSECIDRTGDDAREKPMNIYY